MTKHKEIKDCNNLTIEEHFAELKRRIFVIVVTLLILFAACLVKSGDLISLFLEQGRSAGYTMIALSPQEALLQQLRISFVCGFFIAMPVLIYEVVVFILPAVEKIYIRKTFIAIIAATVLFAAGACFTIFLLFPFMLTYMKDVSLASNVMLEISVENYISFYLTFIVLIGLVFELPIVAVFLTSVGVITPEMMKKGRKVAIVLILVVAAVITPPDVISQLMVAGPMFLLYEISIVLCRILSRKKANV